MVAYVRRRYFFLGGAGFFRAAALFLLVRRNNHLKIDSEVNFELEQSHLRSVGSLVDNFFNLDVSVRQSNLFYLVAAEVKQNTPLGRLQRGVHRRYTYEKKTKNVYDYGRRQRLMSS